MSGYNKFRVSPNHGSIPAAFNAANYARLNPSDMAAATTLIEGNLGATFGANLDSARFLLPKHYGKFVVEATLNVGASGDGVGFGLSTAAFSTSTWLGADANGFCVYTLSYGIYESGVQASATPVWDGAGASCVMAVDLTGANPVISLVLNNDATIDTVYTWTNATLTNEDVYLTLSGSTNDSITLNTGRLRWKNPHIKRLFPDYELGWPDRAEDDITLYRASAAVGVTPQIVSPHPMRAYRVSGRYV